MREQKKKKKKKKKKKNDEKGYFFFRAGQCAVLSSFTVGKMHCIFVGKGYFFFFTSLLKCCDEGCLVVTERRKNCSIFPIDVYCISPIYKGCRSIRDYAF